MCRARQHSELVENLKRKGTLQFCVEEQFIIPALLIGSVETGRRADSSTEMLPLHRASIFYEIHFRYFTVGVWVTKRIHAALRQLKEGS